MKILVTGHLGYIGTVLVPMLLERRGTRSHGMDADWYGRCTFGGSIADVPEHQEGHPRRDRVRPARLRHGAAPGGAEQRPAGELQRRSSPTRSTTWPPCASPRWRATRACGGSSSARRAATTAWRATTSSTRTAAFNPYTPYARAKVAAELALQAA